MVFNSVSVCPLHMNECLLTFKMWEKLQTTYMADKRLLSHASCLLPQAQPPPHPTPSPAVSTLHAHWPRLLPLPRTGRGFLTLGLEDMPFPRPGRFSPAPPAGKLLPSPLVSVQMAPSCTLAPIKIGLSGWLFVCPALSLLLVPPSS